MAHKTTTLAHDPDGPSETQGRFLMEVLTADMSIPFSGLPAAFNNAVGKTPPASDADDVKVKHNRGEQFAAQRQVDRRNTLRTLKHLNCEFAHRGNPKKQK